MGSRMANRENSQLRKLYFDSTIWFSACQNLLCLASLIVDLLGDKGYDFVLTSRFQSDPLERWFRQMSSGRRFLVELRDVTSSDKLLKLNLYSKKILTLIMLRFTTLTMMKQLIDCLIIQTLCPVIRNIFLHQMTAGK